MTQRVNVPGKCAGRKSARLYAHQHIRTSIWHVLLSEVSFVIQEEEFMLNTQRSRPIGITIIAIIMLILGILGIIDGIVTMGAYGTLGIITLILGILEVLLAWGLWTLQSWAYWAVVILEILTILNGIFAFTRGTPGIGTGVVAIVVAVIILIYMFADPNVRAAFRTGI